MTDPPLSTLSLLVFCVHILSTASSCQRFSCSESFPLFLRGSCSPQNKFAAFITIYFPLIHSSLFGVFQTLPTTTYELEIVAKDMAGSEVGLTGTATATITIADKNDHAPEFTHPLVRGRMKNPP